MSGQDFSLRWTLYTELNTFSLILNFRKMHTMIHDVTGGHRSPPLAGRRALFFKRKHQSPDNTNFLEGAGVTDRQPEHFSEHAQGLYGVKNTMEPKYAVPVEKMLCIYHDQYQPTYRSVGPNGYED